MSTVDEVREASKKFYAGLNRMANGEKDTLAVAWSQNGAATAMHPIGGREVGWKAVENSFNQVASVASEGTIAFIPSFFSEANALNAFCLSMK